MNNADWFLLPWSNHQEQRLQVQELDHTNRDRILMRVVNLIDALFVDLFFRR
jgi:hypothetical protein